MMPLWCHFRVAHSFVYSALTALCGHYGLCVPWFARWDLDSIRSSIHRNGHSWSPTIALLRPRRIDAAFLDRALLRFNKVFTAGCLIQMERQMNKVVDELRKLKRSRWNICSINAFEEKVVDARWCNPTIDTMVRFEALVHVSKISLPAPCPCQTVFQEPWVVHSAPNSQMPLQRLVSAKYL